MYDNCAGCEEKNREIDYMQNQLDTIRLLVEEDVKDALLLQPLSSRYYLLTEFRDKILEVLEK